MGRRVTVKEEKVRYPHTDDIPAAKKNRERPPSAKRGVEEKKEGKKASGER